MPPKAKVIEAPAETGPAWTERLIGHEAAEQAFLKAFSAGRLPHAWLISGPQGVGKATFAYRIARFLLAQPIEAEEGGLFGGSAPAAPTNLEMASSQRVFRQVAQQGHPDFRLLERNRAATIGAENQPLAERIAARPVAAREGFIDDHDLRCSCRILRREITPGDQGNTESVEPTGHEII